MVLLATGAVFGLYLPNTPDNVWKSGINQTGDALEKVVTTATEPSKLDSYKSSEISGTADVTYDSQNFTGEFTSKFDQSTSDSGLEVNFKDGSGKAAKVTAKLLTTLAKDSNYPDIYLQVTGMKALGLDSFIPSLTTYDGKWILIDSKYLESVGATYLSGSDNNQKQVTSTDIAAAAQAAAKVTNEYLLTTDSEKAVLTQESFVGKETIGEVKTYHYKVSLNQDHATDYCVALGNAMLSTEAYKKISGATDKEIANTKKELGSSCKDSIKDELKSSDTFDLWIDKSYKLVYKVRVTDSKGSYGEVGQRYMGGNNLTLFSNIHDTERKADSKITVGTNLKTNETSGEYIEKSTGSNPYDIKVTLKAKPSTESVTITKPSPVTPIQEVLTKLNGLFNSI
ncbi:hypothetical protein EYC59_04955 [Candidatus Saccharibacteria bacterium]|nr:MAG: hypothetical protein EYC59_04955 [Candidatus Saccharibacteria bacterium]